MKTILLSISIFFLLPAYSQIVQMKATIYAITGSPVDTILADGNACVFGAPYANAVDNDDVRKSNNIGENFGILRNSITLVIEGRQPVVTKDTIFYRLWNTQQIKYMFKMVPSNFNIPGLTITFEDSLLPANNVQLSTTDTSRVFVTFTSAAGSQAQTRFRVTFKVNSTLPVHFSSFSATPQNGKVGLLWKVEGEKDINKYDVEYSQDGKSFTKLSSVEAKGNNALSIAYNYLHENPSKGINFYRIKSIEKSGQFIYSSVVKVDLNEQISNFQVFPNPVKGQQLNLRFGNKPEGNYTVRLLNQMGQVLLNKYIQHPGGSGQYSIPLNATFTNGIYGLEIVSANKTKELKRVYIYQ